MPEIIHIRPPAQLLAPTPIPACSPCETNEDLLRHALDMRDALGRANADKAAIAVSVETDWKTEGEE